MHKAILAKQMSLQIVFFLLSTLLAAGLFGTTHAVEYHATNNALGTPGGTRFENEIGIPYTEQTLKNAAEFIWQTFRQGEADRKSIQSVSVFVDTFPSDLEQYPAYATGNDIHLNRIYIAQYSGDVKGEVTGMLYHESTHLWQWSVNANGGLIEGIADYVRLKAGYAPSHWPKVGSGSRWDEGYAVTAYFLDYCNGLKDGFVAELNGRMKNGYSDNLFVELLGKSVDQLWNDYKAQYSR